jgi:hypothetical protein
MVSGELAAVAVAEAPAGARGLASRYRRACDHEIGTELRDTVLLQRYLFADRRRIARIIMGAGREAAMTRTILDWLVGRVGYRHARRAVVGRAPLVAARLAWNAVATNRVFRPQARASRI